MNTLAQVITRYRKVMQANYAAGTVTAYMCRLRFLERHIGSMTDLTDITLADLEGCIAEYRQGRRNNTVALAVTVYKAFFQWCQDVELLPRNPAGRLRSPRRNKWQPRALSEASALQLLDLLKTMPQPERWKDYRNEVLVRVLIFGGLRRSEAASLSWEDIDFAGQWIHVIGKGNKKRTIPLLSSLAPHLQTLRTLTGCATGAVFTKDNGLKMHPYTINMIFKRWIVERVAVYVTPHMLRHTFATLLINRGANLDELRDLLGHESVSTTQVYVDTYPERLRGAVEKLKGFGDAV